MAKDTVDDEREDQDDGQPDAPNVEDQRDELAKLLKDIKKERDDERSRNSGLDRKITDQAAEIKTLQEDTYSKDKLLDLREERIKDREAKASEEMAADRAELQVARNEIMKHEVLSKLENFPMRLANRVTGNSEEEVEADAMVLMKDVLREVEPITNARRTTGAPPTGGGGKATDIAEMSPEDALKLSPADQGRWSAAHAKDDEAMLTFLRLQQAQKT